MLYNTNTNNKQQRKYRYKIITHEETLSLLEVAALRARKAAASSDPVNQPYRC